MSIFDEAIRRLREDTMQEVFNWQLCMTGETMLYVGSHLGVKCSMAQCGNERRFARGTCNQKRWFKTAVELFDTFPRLAEIE